MQFGKLQVIEREADIKLHRDTLEEEAWDLRKDGVSISECIKRPDGIHVAAQQGGVRYEIHFDLQNVGEGSYSISGGRYAGEGKTTKIIEGETSFFKHYYRVQVVSSWEGSKNAPRKAAHLFVWRVAIDSFSAVAAEE